jgi:hypothetical protein
MFHYTVYIEGFKNEVKFITIQMCYTCSNFQVFCVSVCIGWVWGGGGHYYRYDVRDLVASRSFFHFPWFGIRIDKCMQSVVYSKLTL